MYRRLLVGFEGSQPARDALALAAGLARIEGAELLLCACLDIDPLASPADAYQRAAGEAESELRAAAREVLGERPFELRVLGGVSAARALTELAETEDADVIVIGSTHRGRIGSVLPGSVGERLLHGAPCAVLVAPRGFAERERLELERLGVGYDEGPESAHALAVAEALARELDASLERITVPPGEGDPADVLARLSRDLDLLVIGSRGYGPLRHALLGGVSAELMRTASCPVLVVPRSASEG
jgi:nucleotide-binding universal stress UspA family protein